MLLQTLERRLDNVVYRMGFAASRAEARQIVKHSHIEVNGRKVNIPSYLVREGDVVAVRESSREHKRIKELRRGCHPHGAGLAVGRSGGLRGTVLRLPNRDEIDTPVQEQLIVEYYSR